MSTNFWKVPVWETPIDQAVRVDLFRLPNQGIISENGWPETFWQHIQDCRSLDEEESQHIIQLFQELAPGTSDRCHMPPWGLAFYDNERLLFTTTLCFKCSNAYVYTALGKELRAFDVDEFHAEELFALLTRELPL